MRRPVAPGCACDDSTGGRGLRRADPPVEDARAGASGGPVPLALDEVRLPLTEIKPERGRCYVARIPLLTPNERDDRQTGLRLFEDGVELTAGGARHAEIRELGGGRFSHWGASLYFSSSDGSDPLTSGRAYSIIFSQAQVVADSRWAFTPVVEIAPAEIKSGEGFASAYDLPVTITGWASDLETLNGSRLVLLEDGVPLPLAHARFEEIGSLGRGRYLHVGPRVWFSTTDNSDPRENGRRYVIALGDMPDHRFVDPLAGKHRPDSVVLAPPRLAWPREGAVIDEARPTFRVADADDSLLYFWELDVEPTFDSANLHRQPRMMQMDGAVDLLRTLDREPGFAPKFRPPYRLGALAPVQHDSGSELHTTIMAGRLGYGLSAGEDELREVYAYVHAQLYPVDADANIRDPDETWRRDRGYCVSVNYLASSILEEMGYRTRRAQVSVPAPNRLGRDRLYSHSSLEVFFDGQWSIFDPWFGFLLIGISYQDLAAAAAPMIPAIRVLAPPEDPAYAGDWRLLHLNDYAQQRRYDRFDTRFAPISDAESERLVYSGEPAMIIDPEWWSLWMQPTMHVWVRVRAARLPVEAVDPWMLPREDVNDYRPEVVEVSPWTTVSFTIDLAAAYGFERDE